jgi:glycosyltransferase involved in cell wall biosynthesis
MIKLSILIASMPAHLAHLDGLMQILSPQITGEVEIVTDSSMGYNIGTKRNKLLEMASGEYIVFIDADDRVSPKYVELILNAIKTRPDCVGISGYITTNGGNMRQWYISKDYGYWYELNNVYYRTPNHISPVKRELALQARFPEWTTAEDAEYSKRLYPLLNTEVKIEGNIYHYNYFDHK